MMTKIGTRLVLLIAIGATIGCDRVTKHVAATTLAEASSRSFLADTFRLEYVENTGAFLGLGADWPRPVRTAVFGVGNGFLLLAVAVVAVHYVARHIMHLSAGDRYVAVPASAGRFSGALC